MLFRSSSNDGRAFRTVQPMTACSWLASRADAVNLRLPVSPSRLPASEGVHGRLGRARRTDPLKARGVDPVNPNLGTYPMSHAKCRQRADSVPTAKNCRTKSYYKRL